MRWLLFPAEEFIETVEATVPAFVVAVALIDGGEADLMEDHFGMGAVVGEGEGDEHFVAGFSVVVIPREGEDHALELDEFVVATADPEFLAAVGGNEVGAPSAADPEIVLIVIGRMMFRAHPLDHLLGIGPRVPDEPSWSAEGAMDDEFGGGRSGRAHELRLSFRN